jgi:hypothetical protein
LNRRLRRIGALYQRKGIAGVRTRYGTGPQLPPDHAVQATIKALEKPSKLKPPTP